MSPHQQRGAVPALGQAAPQWDWENWAFLTTAMRWELLMLAGETDLIPWVWAALCCGGTRDKAALLEERPFLPDCPLRGKPGPRYCSEDHELSVVSVQSSPADIEANMNLNMGTFLCT